MSKYAVLMMIILGGFGLSYAGTVTFDEVDGYTNGNSVVGGALSPESSFALQLGGDGAAVVDGQALKVSLSTGAAWIKDVTPTIYNDITNIWSRSVDVTMDTNTVGTANKISVALMNGDEGVGGSINWASYATNYVLDVIISEQSDTIGQFFIRRRNSAGTSNEGYQYTTGNWVLNSVYQYPYDITHTLKVAYEYNPFQEKMSLTVYDQTAASNLIFEVIDLADLPPYVGGTNTVRFGTGDMWLNSGKDVVAKLDNVSTEFFEAPAEDLAVTFDEADGYTNGNSVAAGTLSPDSSFVYQIGGDGAAVVENQALKISVGTGAAWVKDISSTAYADMYRDWIRSVDVKIDTATTGTADKVNVSLLNGTDGGGNAIPWTTYATNYVCEVSIAENDDTTGQFMLRRRNSDGSGNEGYNFNTDTWTTSNYQYLYDITHTLNVTYVYDPDLEQLNLTVRDMTALTNLISIVMDKADLAPFVGGANTVRFGAGDFWTNSGKDTTAFLDNIAKVLPSDPAPSEDPYDDWMLPYSGSLSAADQQKDADPDDDGMDNFLEYALGGDPTVSDADSILPVNYMADEGLMYLYNRRADYASLGLSYYLELTTDLVTTAFTNDLTAYTETGVSTAVDGFETVTNLIITVDDAKFVTLKVAE